jgi:hypothetical protein
VAQTLINVIFPFRFLSQLKTLLRADVSLGPDLGYLGLERHKSKSPDGVLSCDLQERRRSPLIAGSMLISSWTRTSIAAAMPGGYVASA